MTRFTTRGGRGLAATLALAGVLLLGGCGGGTDENKPAPAGAPNPPAATDQPVASPDGKPAPTNIRIPKIKAESSLIALALKQDGSLAVPDPENPMQASWYELGPVPGEPGPAIILGHVDGNKKPGIFFKLHELAAGDEVFVRKSDGTEVKFVVNRKEQVPKEKFPHDAVYGGAEQPELRLITCGGAFDNAAHSYKDNVIIYARRA